jgi:hypothetical protein
MLICMCNEYLYSKDVYSLAIIICSYVKFVRVSLYVQFVRSVCMSSL